MKPIASAFGNDFVSPDGSLDRARMRALVFSDPDAKRRLEAILHPLIDQPAATTSASRRHTSPRVPLLLETESYAELLDRVLVVDWTKSAIERVIARSGLAERRSGFMAARSLAPSDSRGRRRSAQ